MNSSHLDGDVGGIWKKFNRCKGKQYAQRQEGAREHDWLWNHKGLSVMDLEWRERCGMEK